MEEFKRIYRKKTTILLIVGLIFAQVIAYFYNETEISSIEDIKAYTTEIEAVLDKGFDENLTKEELEIGIEYDVDGMVINPPDLYEGKLYLIGVRDYHKEYSLYYEQIESNAQSMMASLDEDASFQRKNIVKTLEDFQGTKDLELEIGDNRNVNSFTDYEITDYLIIIFLIYIVVSFFEDRKKGLSQMVRATKKGRFSLAVSRLVTLAVSSFVISGILYAVLYICTTWLYGGDNTRLIQSVAEFKECEKVITIAAFFIEYVVIKAAVLFFVGILAYLVMTIINNISVTMIILALFVGGQYILYESIPYTGRFVILKFLNIFSFLDTKNLYAEYHNVDFFGKPVEIREMLFVGAVIMIWLIVITVVANTFMYKSIEFGFIKKISEKWAVFKNNHLRYRSLGNWELRKILFLNKGILAVIAFMLFAVSSISNTSARDTWSVGAFKESYYDKYENVVCKEITDEIDSVRDEYLIADGDLMKAEQKLFEGKITEDEYYIIQQEYDSKKAREDIFASIQGDIDYLEDLEEERGIEGKLINSTGYRYLFGYENTDTYYRKAIILLIAIILLCYNTFSSDRQSGFISIVKSTGTGRLKSFKSRIISAGICATMISIIMYAIEYYNVWLVYGFDELLAPVQSIEFMMDYPFEISIAGFMAIWYIIRLVVVWAIVMIVMCISMYSKTGIISLWMSMGVLVLPALLTYIGIDMVSCVSVLKSMFMLEIWLVNGFDSIWAYIPFVVMILVAIVAFVLLKMRYLDKLPNMRRRRKNNETGIEEC